MFVVEGVPVDIPTQEVFVSSTELSKVYFSEDFYFPFRESVVFYRWVPVFALCGSDAHTIQIVQFQDFSF